MTDAREIIAQQVRCGNVDRVSLEVSDNVINALTSAGFRILGPDEVDQVTWQPIETAPALKRVLVAGWQSPRGRTRGYWWFYEDYTDETGKPISHPEASLFLRPASVLPSFPPDDIRTIGGRHEANRGDGGPV